jgi:hypothetical protein
MSWLRGTGDRGDLAFIDSWHTPRLAECILETGADRHGWPRDRGPKLSYLPGMMDHMRQRQLQFFTPSELAKMRDPAKSRDYSPERDEFRRIHERRRAWGKAQRHSQRWRQLRDRPQDDWPEGSIWGPPCLPPSAVADASAATGPPSPAKSDHPAPAPQERPSRLAPPPAAQARGAAEAPHRQPASATENGRPTPSHGPAPSRRPALSQGPAKSSEAETCRKRASTQGSASSEVTSQSPTAWRAGHIYPGRQASASAYH